MSTIEEQVAQIWDPSVRPLADEAWRCYGVGAYRACITLTWVAVCADLSSKILRLADDGDGDAAAVRKDIEAAEQAGLSAAGIQQSQNLEKAIVSVAQRLELIDSIAARELERLREDRHLCAHPSARGLGDTFSPRADAARAHLAGALENVLVMPATQGKAVVERFAAHVADPRFTPSHDYLAQNFFDRVRPAARRRIIDLAVKHALLELAAPDPPGAAVVADRMAQCLIAFAERDAFLVRDAMSKVMSRLPDDGTTLLRTFSRVGHVDMLWDLVDDPLASRVRSLVEGIEPADIYGRLDPNDVAVLALARSSVARARVNTLEPAFAQLRPRARAEVMAHRIDPYFAPHVSGLLRDAGGWRSAEEMTRNAVVPYGPLLRTEELAACLDGWANNEQCRTASAMVDLAQELYRATAHLRPHDEALWAAFLVSVRNQEPPGSAYTYVGLEALMASGPK